MEMNHVVNFSHIAHDFLHDTGRSYAAQSSNNARGDPQATVQHGGLTSTFFQSIYHMRTDPWGIFVTQYCGKDNTFLAEAQPKP